VAEPVRVRAAAASDRARIAAINREGQPGVNPLSAAELDACLARATLFCVAELDGAVAGYLIALATGFSSIGDEYAWFEARHRAFLYVDQVAVARDGWRRGVGAALYAELERVARRSGIPQLVCEVNLRPANPRSLAFHAALGFVEVGQLEVSDGRRVALLERALVQSPR
jgi:predicted GNAT superfamily acetyltransferase